MPENHMVVDSNYHPVYCHNPASVRRWLLNQNVRKIRDYSVRVWKNGGLKYVSVRDYLEL